ncbi:MAG: hypothetical protein KGM14_04150, partial [Actinomycetales bacterium]|nr:hypothetical protein [Actinomycetales bacterium]
MSAPQLIASGQEGNLKEQITAYFQRIKNGDMGALPAVIALVALAVLFTALSPVFLSRLNFANLFVQSAELTVLACALVFVLLLAEIDLSAGVTAGVGMGLYIIMNQMMGLPWWIAVIGALALGLAVGALIGFFVAKVGVPSFIVTLGLFLGFQGLLLIMLGDGGLYRVEQPEILALMNSNLPDWAGWLMVALMIVVTLGLDLWDRSRRLGAGLPVRPISLTIAKVVAIGGLASLAVAFLNENRSVSIIPISGVPIVIP